VAWFGGAILTVFAHGGQSSDILSPCPLLRVGSVLDDDDVSATNSATTTLIWRAGPGSRQSKRVTRTEIRHEAASASLLLPPIVPPCASQFKNLTTSLSSENVLHVEKPEVQFKRSVFLFGSLPGTAKVEPLSHSIRPPVNAFNTINRLYVMGTCVCVQSAETDGP
jgi:hypothetical protein